MRPGDIFRAFIMALILGMPLFLAGALSSCSSVPTPIADGKGGHMSAKLFAGQGALDYDADGSLHYTYNNQKSFQHATQAISSLGLSYISYLGNLAKEITSRLATEQLNITQREALVVQLETVKAQLAAAQNGQAMTGGLFAPEATPYKQQ